MNEYNAKIISVIILSLTIAVVSPIVALYARA